MSVIALMGIQAYRAVGWPCWSVTSSVLLAINNFEAERWEEVPGSREEAALSGKRLVWSSSGLVLGPQGLKSAPASPFSSGQWAQAVRHFPGKSLGVTSVEGFSKSSGGSARE